MGMKNILLRIGLILALATLVFVFLGCSRGKILQDHGKHGFTIRPLKGGHLKFEEKFAYIKSEVLDKYPYLYYIEEFKDGKPVGEPIGNSCNLLPLANLEVVSKMARETDPPYTGHAVQIGIGLSEAVEDSECLDGGDCPRDESLVSHSPQAHYQKYIDNSEIMTRKIKEILDGP